MKRTGGYTITELYLAAGKKVAIAHVQGIIVAQLRDGYCEVEFIPHNIRGARPDYLIYDEVEAAWPAS